MSSLNRVRYISEELGFRTAFLDGFRRLLQGHPACQTHLPSKGSDRTGVDPGSLERPVLAKLRRLALVASRLEFRGFDLDLFRDLLPLATNLENLTCAG